MPKIKKVTKAQQRVALAAVAAWLGPRMGYDGPAPTGEDAAYRGEGPMLNPEWDWPSGGPTPTILLEGGPEDWAIWASADEGVREALRKVGAWSEPYASYALCIYPLSNLSD